MAMVTQEETKMRRLVLAVAGLTAMAIAVPAPASAQVNASRLYKLCWMEDPECLPTLRTVYFLAMAKMANKTHMERFTCGKGNDLPDQLLFYEFMHGVQMEPAILEWTAIEAEMEVLSFGVPACRIDAPRKEWGEPSAAR
jgi:hypothetical protein